MKINEFNRQKAQVSFYKAWDLINQNKLEAGFHSLKNSIKYYPRFVPAHLLYLEMLKQKDDQDKLTQYSTTLEKEDNEVNLYIRGLMSENFDEKKKFFSLSLQAAPDYFWVLYTLNLMLHDQPQLQESITSIISKPEESATFYYTRGLIEHYYENLEEAILNYVKALNIDKRLVDAHFNLAVAYNDRNEAALAIKHYEKTINYNPYFIDGYYNLGCHYFSQGEYKQSSDYFKQALQIDPYFFEAHNNLAICYIKMGIQAAAEIEFKKAIQISPLNRDIHVNYEYFLSLTTPYETTSEDSQKTRDFTQVDQPISLQKGLECLEIGKLQGHQLEWKLSPVAKPDTPMIHSLKKLL